MEADRLFDGLKKNDNETFEKLFRYYYPRVMAYATSFVETAVAEDIVQDVFLYVWENRKKLSVGERFHAYLFQAAYTRCLDYLKKNLPEERYRAYLDEVFPDGFVFDGEKIVEALSMQDFYKQLYHLLEQLPEQRREVFLLTYIEGMKAQEVAEHTHIPRRTVESHLYLSLKYLRKYLKKGLFCLLT